jgi:hypothetical protein
MSTGSNAFFDNYSTQVAKRVVIDAATLGDNTLVAAVTGKKIRVLDIVLISAGAMTIRFESGASGTALTGQMTVAAGTGFAPGYNPLGHFETAAGALLNMELSAGTSADGWLVYVEVDDDGRP